jgi:hypothetical protein
MADNYIIQPRMAYTPVPLFQSEENVYIQEFALTQAGADLLSAITAVAGVNYRNLAQALGFVHHSILQPGGNGTVIGSMGFPSQTATGTATARNVATTSLFTRTKRIGYDSAAGAGSLCGLRVPNNQVTVGSGTVGGFGACFVFGCADSVTAGRQFVGIADGGAPTNVEPSTLTNVIGIGNGGSDSNLKIFYGGSAAQTPIDLGANFPSDTASTDMYMALFLAPTQTNNKVGYYVKRLNTGHVASGVLTAATPGTQLPASTTLLSHLQAWRSNNATATAVLLDIAYVWAGMTI